MEESYTSLPTSHLLGSVPAVITEEKTPTNYDVPEANMQTFPPNKGGPRYQTLGGPSGAADGDEQPPTGTWKGVFSVSSYTQYFNVDTDIVLNRLLSSLYPVGGDFFSKIDANPDLYGLIWIATTLVFVLSALGNCATYLMDKRSDSSTTWSFDVSYFNVAAILIYGYAILVPLGFYFLLQYLDSNASLIWFWCMWGYSLFIFVPTSILLIIPVEVLRWIIILLVGVASGCFVSLNLRSLSNRFAAVVASFILQLGLALFVKIYFFP